MSNVETYARIAKTFPCLKGAPELTSETMFDFEGFAFKGTATGKSRAVRQAVIFILEGAFPESRDSFRDMFHFYSAIECWSKEDLAAFQAATLALAGKN